MKNKFLYVVSPLGAVGGGMFRVADYLVGYQKEKRLEPRMELLDSRGQSLYLSPFILFLALIKILYFRLTGQLEGLHVNVAERLSLVRKGVIIAFGRLLGLPVIAHLHAAQLHACYKESSWLGKKLTRFVFLSASVCVVLGSRARVFLINEIGVKEEKVFVLVNGVPVGAPAQAKKKADEFRLLFLGNLSERKGVSDLLKALSGEARLRDVDWHLTLAGGGGVEHYKELASTLGIRDKLEFPGWIDQVQAAQLMADSDVLVLPSYDEGLPLVILEALGRGLPVICTPVGEIPEFLVDGQDALFVKPGDINQLAEAIVRIYSSSELRAVLSLKGLDAYRSKFSIDVFFSSLKSIYALVIK